MERRLVYSNLIWSDGYCSFGLLVVLSVSLNIKAIACQLLQGRTKFD